MITRRSHARRKTAAARSVVCPSCGAPAVSAEDRTRLWEELQTEWWSLDPRKPGAVSTTRHCYQCQPHKVYVVACLLCGDGPLLAGELAEQALNSAAGLPQLVVDELTRNRWRKATNVDGWVCANDTVG